MSRAKASAALKLPPLERVKQEAPSISKGERDAIHSAAKLAVILRGVAARANAFPVLAEGSIVRTGIFGWRGHDAAVVQDAGSARDGTRPVTIKKVSGPRSGEQVTVRRDRVTPMPG